MIDTPSVPKPREGAWLWLYKIVAGLFIVVLLGVHFIVNHLVAPEGLLSYNDVVRYYTNPIVPVMEIAFLIFVISHALVGLRSILLDLNPSDKAPARDRYPFHPGRDWFHHLRELVDFRHCPAWTGRLRTHYSTFIANCN